MACSVLVIGEMQPNIHTIEKFDFLKSIFHSQIILILCYKFELVNHKIGDKSKMHVFRKTDMNVTRPRGYKTFFMLSSV